MCIFYVYASHVFSPLAKDVLGAHTLSLMCVSKWPKHVMVVVAEQSVRANIRGFVLVQWRATESAKGHSILQESSTSHSILLTASRGIGSDTLLYFFCVRAPTDTHVQNVRQLQCRRIFRALGTCIRDCIQQYALACDVYLYPYTSPVCSTSANDVLGAHVVSDVLTEMA